MTDREFWMFHSRLYVAMAAILPAMTLFLMLIGAADFDWRWLLLVSVTFVVFIVCAGGARMQAGGDK
jgi:type II secretory pathway component PulF